jgi:predicted RND superfamily exporter protein
LVVLIVAIALIAVAFTRPFSLDSGGGGFVPRTDELGIRKDSVLAGLDWTIFSELVNNDLPPSAVQAQQSVPSNGLQILYVRDAAALARDGNPNILYDAAIDEIRRFETEFAARNNYTDFCLAFGGTCTQAFSLTNYFWPPGGLGPDKTNETIPQVMVDIPQESLERLVDTNYRYPSNIATETSQALYSFAFPLAGFNNSQNEVEAQDALYEEWILVQRQFFIEFNNNSTEIDLLWLGSFITTADTNALLLGDAAWAGAAILFVVVWMCLHTMSFWLGLWGMFHIILSFPVAYFFVVIAMNVRSFNTLNMLGIFILLGIGADDVFIMVDRWKQSAYRPGCTTHAKRMAWAFKSAAKSMFVTSFTTSIAFFINASSTIAPIRVFGIFVGILILINYIFVITMYPAWVSIWGHYFENQCLDKQIKSCTNRKPHDLAENEKKEDVSVPQDLAEKNRVKKMRFIERFFYFKYYRFIRFWRWLIMLVLLGAFIGLLVMATRLQPAQEPAKFIPDDYPLARAFTLSGEAFNSTPAVSTVNIYWGVLGVDRTGTDPNDPNDIGVPIWDPAFDVSSAAAQLYMISTCDEAKLQPTTFNQEVTCPMNDLRDWLLLNNRTFPSLNITQDFKDYTDFYAIENNVRPYERGAAGFSGIRLPKSYQTSIRFNNITGELQMIQFIVNTTIDRASVAKDLRPFYLQWESFTQNISANAPMGLENVEQISDRWTAIATEDALFQAAIFGLWTSLVVAFAVLLVLTLNVINTFITIFHIGMVVTCVIGVFVSAGWSLGIIESICLTIVVGLSVDYSAHMGDSYNASKKGHRHGRSRDMLATIGLTIFSAGLTTVGSACFLFGTTIIFFNRFGAFIVITVGFSLVFALLGMPSTLYTIGPNGNKGELLWFFRNKPEFIAKHLNYPDHYDDLDKYNATHDKFGRKLPEVSKMTTEKDNIEKEYEKGVIEL